MHGGASPKGGMPDDVMLCLYTLNAVFAPKISGGLEISLGYTSLEIIDTTAMKLFDGTW